MLPDGESERGVAEFLRYMRGRVIRLDANGRPVEQEYLTGDSTNADT